MSEENEKQIAVIELSSPAEQNSYEEEFDELKQSLYDVAMTSKEALAELKSFANAAQHPQVWSALAKLVVAINDTHGKINDVIVNKYESKKIVETKPASDEPQKLENHNHLHVSSTEFLQMVKKAAN